MEIGSVLHKKLIPVLVSLVVVQPVFMSYAVHATPVDSYYISKEPAYLKGIPDKHNRAENPKDVGTFGKKKWTKLEASLEFITDNNNHVVVNNQIFNVIRDNSKFKEWCDENRVSVSDFRWLIIREISIINDDIQIVEVNGKTGYRVPFIFDLRYAVEVPVWETSHKLNRNGTLEVLAFLNIIVDSSGNIETIKVGAYDDSSTAERLARKFGFLKKFNGKFIEGVSKSSLEAFFAISENLQPIVQIVQTIQESSTLK